MNPPGTGPNDDFERDLEREGLRTGPEDEGRWGWSPGRIATVCGLVLIIAFWVWAFSPLAPRGHPDKLDDDTFSVYAEGRCSTAVNQVANDVPLASAAATVGERAEQINEATDIFAVMVEDLTERAPEVGSRDGDLVQLWLTDWGIYLDDRYAYAEDFRAGLDAPFTVTVAGAGRGQITDPIDSFAIANLMDACASPQDV